VADKRVLRVVVTGDTDDLEKAFKKTGAVVEDFDAKSSKFSGALGRIGETAAGVFAGGVLLGGVEKLGNLLMGSAKAAMEDEAAQRRLATTLRNTIAATDAQVASVEDFIDVTQRALGVADDELRPAFDILVRSTGDVTKAQEVLKVALDVSAGTGKDLTTVSTALSKAMEGNTGAASRLVPELTGLIKEGASADEVMQQLATTFGGQASANAETFQGKMNRLNIAWGEAQEKLGEKLLPVLTDLATWLTETGIPKVEAFAGWIEKTSTKVGDWFTKTDDGKATLETFRVTIEGIADALQQMYDILGPVVRRIDDLVEKAGGLGNVLGLAKAFAGGSGLGGFGGIFKAEGGPVRAGQPYIVGEKRPELFIPEVNGMILPRVPSGRGGTPPGSGTTIIVQGSVISERELLDVIRRAERRGLSFAGV
jgi:hypothetical protein